MSEEFVFTRKKINADIHEESSYWSCGTYTMCITVPYVPETDERLYAFAHVSIIELNMDKEGKKLYSCVGTLHMTDYYPDHIMHIPTIGTGIFDRIPVTQINPRMTSPEIRTLYDLGEKADTLIRKEYPGYCFYPDPDDPFRTTEKGSAEYDRQSEYILQQLL